MKEYAWAIVDPTGHITADSRWLTESDAWDGEAEIRDGQGWIEAAKNGGYRAIRVRLFEVGPA